MSPKGGGGNPKTVKYSHTGSGSYQTGETETFPLIVKLGLNIVKQYQSRIPLMCLTFHLCLENSHDL